MGFLALIGRTDKPMCLCMVLCGYMNVCVQVDLTLLHSGEER